jgi:hypothetical protein
VTGSDCFTSGTATGTITGNSVVIGVAFPGGQQVNFSGTVGANGATMSGSFGVSGGLCHGDFGTWSLTKTS